VTSVMGLSIPAAAGNSSRLVRDRGHPTRREVGGRPVRPGRAARLVPCQITHRTHTIEFRSPAAKLGSRAGRVEDVTASPFVPPVSRCEHRRPPGHMKSGSARESARELVQKSGKSCKTMERDSRVGAARSTAKEPCFPAFFEGKSPPRLPSCREGAPARNLRDASHLLITISVNQNPRVPDSSQKRPNSLTLSNRVYDEYLILTPVLLHSMSATRGRCGRRSRRCVLKCPRCASD
jgi:hypothetical protein